MTQRSAVVTGCSSGFGLGIARALHERGWRVTACVRSLQDGGESLAGCEVFMLDVRESAQIEELARRFDRLHCLVNNAGYALTGPLASYDAQQMRAQLETNVVAPAVLIQALLPALARARGRVINIGSLAGEVGLPLNAMYCASKAALHALTDALRRELSDHGVQVAAVVAGGHRTRFMSNMVWGARATQPNAVETRQLDQYRAWQRRVGGQRGQSPDPVVRAVVRLAQCARMPARTYVGTDARLAHALQRLLPATWVDALMTSALRKRMRAS